MTKTLTHSPEQQEMKRKPLLGGMLEGIRNYRERSRIESLLIESISSSAEDASDFEAAMKSFSGLSPKAKEKIMLNMADMLERHSSFPYETDAKANAVIPIAVFFAEAAKQLPADDDGRRISSPHKKAIALLTSIAQDGNFFQRGNKVHETALLSCVIALKELGYMDKGFWERRLADQTTRMLAVNSLLDSHMELGWSILEENLKDAAYFIAKSVSPKKQEFFLSLLEKDAPQTLVYAMQGAIYLDEIPEDFIAAVRRLNHPHEQVGLNASEFLLASEYKAQLGYAGGVQFDAASNLIHMYRLGSQHLLPLLGEVALEMRDVFFDPPGQERTGRTETQYRAIGVLALLKQVGIEVSDIKIKFEGELNG